MLDGGAVEPDAFTRVGTLGVSISPSQLRLRQGESATIEVTVARADFDGPVSISLGGLPSGVAADPVTLPEGVRSGTIVVQATDAAELGGPSPFEVRVAADGMHTA